MITNRLTPAYNFIIMKIRKILITVLLLICSISLFSQPGASTSDKEARQNLENAEDPASTNPMDTFITDLMQKMTLQEKIGQMNLLNGGDLITGEGKPSDLTRKIREGQVGAFLNFKSVAKIREVQRIAVEESRLGIPLIFGMDVIHGYRTTFPIPLALASSFDMKLIEQSARVAATEATADGICWTFSPMVDITRDPRWGRIAEGAGEDVFLGSRVAEAYVQGYQGGDLSAKNTIMSCVKHFALYGAPEAGRDYNTVDMSRVRMYNEYFPPYKAAIDAGAASVMTSFNEVDGIPATGNKWLMTDVLRDQWGFDGLIVTDWASIKEMTDHGVGNEQQVTALALNAGVDLDMSAECYISYLGTLLSEGTITEVQINQACRRILEAKYKLGLFDDPYRYCDPERAKNELFTEENNRIARETASQTFVLLKNDDHLLPLEKKGKIALVGPLADNRYNVAGCWSVAVNHDESVTVLEGFRNAVGDKAKIVYAKGSNVVDDPDIDLWTSPHGKRSFDSVRSPEQLRAEAVAVASECDVIVAVMGESAEMSGESASRTDIGLPGSQQELLKALLQTGKPVVLVLFTGRPLTLTWEQENVPAILNAWFGGTQAGNAIADVIFGEVNPSGKLPVTFPQNVGQIPIYYNYKNTGHPQAEGIRFQKYRSNYLDVTNKPLYPFGFGLSYTHFTYGDIVLDKTQLAGNQTLTATISIRNSGNYDGYEVVQLYVRDIVGSITRPLKELKDFQKVYLRVGETKTVTFTITPDDLKFYNYDLDYDWEPGEFEIMIGGNSRDVKSAKVFWGR